MDANRCPFHPMAARLLFAGALLLLWALPGPPPAAAQAPAAATPLDRMAKRAVFWDDRLDSVGQAKHQGRLVRWLAGSGFEALASEALAAWLKERVIAGDAYGSVVVMTMGFAPAYVAEEPGERILWVRYLKAGGRIVSIGDLPFNYYEYPDARPLPPGMGERGYGALGLTGGWNQPYWGRHLKVTPTPQAKEWGFETMDGSISGFAAETVTIPFGTYVVPESGKLGASSWLKSLRPELPWSGLIKLCQFFDGNNDAQVRDVWRAAHYVGKPVELPALLPPHQADAGGWQIGPGKAMPPTLRVTLTASGLAGRTEFARGEEATVSVSAEKLDATAVRWQLLEGDRLVLNPAGDPPYTLRAEGARVAARGEAALRTGANGSRTASFALKTAPLAFGAYTLVVTPAPAGDQAIQVTGVRTVPPEGFHWQIWVNTPANPYRRDMTFADVKAHGMEPHLTDTSIEGMDSVLRQNQGFSLRAHPDLANGKGYAWEKTPEFFRLDLDRKPIPSAYAGGRPTLGICHPDILENARVTLRDAIKPAASHPAFQPYVLTNDDFSIYYGWDFAGHVVERFKRETGLDAPAKMETPPTGPVEESNPWLRWCEFTLREVSGAVNRAETQGATEARPDIRIGPIPGGMQIPYVHMWQAAQYPPLNFGKNGFNLLCCYYYNTYWQPVLTNTYWQEIGRMGNRGLPQWCMPDVFMTTGYQRNNLFHLLAGGVKGLAYYTYPERNPGTWAEVKHLGPQVRRVGPVQARLKPAGRKLGVLLSLTTNCFDPGHDLLMVYAYANLVQAHLDVEMTCEEEILAGRAREYGALLLYHVRWLRKPVYDALAAHAAAGGVVLLDNTVPFDIPGAKRVNVDTGMGKERTIGMPPEGAHASTPGIRDYGDPARVAAIRKALAPYVKPAFECDDIRLTATRFEASGVPYLWFVNTHTGKEYMFCRERMGAGHPGARTPDKVADLAAWEKREMAGGPYTVAPVFAKLPGVPYDLVAGRPVRVAKTPSGVALHLSMERFGGSLVAFYPEAIQRVAIQAPAVVKPMQAVTAEIRVLGAKRPIAGIVPVEVTLSDPAGKPSPLSGVFAAESGVLRFRWTPATNDLRGKWTLRAVELASGKQGAAAVRLWGGDRVNGILGAWRAAYW